MVQIVKASKDLPSLNILVYADSGAGKTVFAASAPRVLFIAPEDTGIVSAVNLGYDPDKITVRNWRDFVEAYEWVYDNQFDLAEKYDWIVIDSITKMQEICMTSILEDQRAQRISKDQDPDVPQIQDYQKLYILVEKLILAFNDIAINILYTALANSKEDPDGDEFLLPMIGSNRKDDIRIAMKCASHMTSYGYFKVEIVEKASPTPEDPKKTKRVKQRVIYWEDTGTYRGKDRTTKMTPKTVLPTRNALDFITNLINGKVDRDGKPLAQVAKKTPAKKAAVKASPVVESKDTLARNDSDPISAVPPGEAPKEGEANVELASVEA